MSRSSQIRVTHFELAGLHVAILSLPTQLGLTLSELTPAEQDVAGMLVVGATHAEIARVRGTSVRTVANQAASIYRKLHVGSRAELAAMVMSSNVGGEA